MVGTDHRTHPEPTKKAIQDRTPKGAASWSIGPHKCRDCIHWWGSSSRGRQDEQPCQKAIQLSAVKRTAQMKIYGGTLSCRYFEKKPEAKPLTTPPPKQYSSADFGSTPADDEVPF